MLPKCASVFALALIRVLAVQLQFDVVQCRKIPENIRLCAKNDPELDKCLTDLFNSEKYRLKDGVPEMGLVQMDPYFKSELVLFSGFGGSMKAIARNTTFYGLGNATFNDVKVKLDTRELIIDVTFGYVNGTGEYDLNGNFAGIRLKGKGQMTAFAVEPRVVLTYKGEFTNIDGEEHLIYNQLAADTSFTDIGVRLEGLTRSKVINDATNALVNRSRFIIYKLYKSAIDRVFAELFGEIINGVAKTVPSKEFFA